MQKIHHCLCMDYFLSFYLVSYQILERHFIRSLQISLRIHSPHRLGLFNLLDNLCLPSAEIWRHHSLVPVARPLAAFIKALFWILRYPLHLPLCSHCVRSLVIRTVDTNQCERRNVVSRAGNNFLFCYRGTCWKFINIILEQKENWSENFELLIEFIRELHILEKSR